MDNAFSMSGLLPLWIIGAPFLVGLVSMFTTPKPTRSDVRDPRVPQTSLSPGGLSAAHRT